MTKPKGARPPIGDGAVWPDVGGVGLGDDVVAMSPSAEADAVALCVIWMTGLENGSARTQRSVWSERWEVGSDTCLWYARPRCPAHLDESFGS